MNSAPSQATGAQSLALFRQPRALDSAAHRQLRYDANQPYHFAAQQLFAPIVSGEADMVAREYPIVFSDQPNSLPMALLGRARGHNAYVHASGRWQARYVPAHFRRYPFVMAETAAPGAAAGEGASAIQHIVVFDADAAHFGTERGERLFTDEGQPTETLVRVQRVLAVMERDSRRTLPMVEQLETLGLLVERQVVVSSRKGEATGLQGLRVVDFERLNALAPEQLAALQHSGALALATAHRVSMTNLQNSVLVDNETVTRESGSGTVSFEGIDWSKF